MYCCDRSNVSSERSQDMPRSIGQCSEPQLARAPEGTSASAARMTTMRQAMECILRDRNEFEALRWRKRRVRDVGRACASDAWRRIGGYGVSARKLAAREWNRPCRGERRGRRAGWVERAGIRDARDHPGAFAAARRGAE